VGGGVTDAKDRRIAELEAERDILAQNFEESARQFYALEAERDEADSLRHGRLLAVIEAHQVERDRLRAALTEIASEPLKNAHYLRRVARAVLAGEEKPDATTIGERGEVSGATWDEATE
jgi:hypothetical protein